MDNLKPLGLEEPVGDAPLVIAGPCSAETEEQTLLTAHALRKAGVALFRAGIWKPRTMPGSFEGVGERGLPWLRKVKEQTGLPTATEVATPAHVEAALAHGVDVLWIGARTTTSPFAMQELACALRGVGSEVPVLVKNPVAPDLANWIGALERLAAAGVTRLGAVHRGFATYGDTLYRNAPQWRLPLELRTRLPELPIFCDPSHIGGSRPLVEPLSREALDMGFDGLMVEVHCRPECALSDSRQQLTPDELARMLKSLKRRSAPLPEEGLETMRREIDRLDAELVSLLAKRMEVAEEIGRYKKQRSIAIVQPERYGSVISSRLEQAANAGLDPRFMRRLLSLIHEESVRTQVAGSARD